ncbi:MAG: lycopene beta-cyclase CrtY [Myxococcaceae bacterium]|nr:lycopene beta-cyclase CrtY [Myxococcaceae bacterium]
MLDLILVGGGLAHGLLAWRLLQLRPDVAFAIIEAGPTVGGNHTWSFHGSDLTPAQLEWLWVLAAKSWPSHDVIFKTGARRIGGGYHSITSEGFHWKLKERLKDRLRLKTKVSALTATSVTLSTGETLEAKAVIDGRGFSSAPTWPCGYQKFLGLDVELTSPHGLEVPLLMDGRVEQHGAFRFVYLLPWDERRVLIEDTYYADTADLSLDVLRGRIRQYLGERGLTIATVHREESAALPIPLTGAPPRLEQPTLGVAGGFFHATTGYSLPFAVELADALAQRSSFEAASLTPWLQERAERHWASQGFFRLLNRMLFKGADPDERVRIFESFYQHDEALIAHFYAGRLTPFDVLKVLARGSRTVPFPRAFKASFSLGG